MASTQSTYDYYSILEISRAADTSTVKAAYRRLARIKHPDKNKGTPTATAEFQRLQTAYATLSDTDKRRTYDRENPLPRRPAPESSPGLSREKSTRQTPQKWEYSPARLEALRKKEADLVASHWKECVKLDAIQRGIRQLEVTMDTVRAEGRKEEASRRTTVLGYVTSILPGNRRKIEEKELERAHYLSTIRAQRDAMVEDLTRQSNVEGKVSAAWMRARVELRRCEESVHTEDNEREAAARRSGVYTGPQRRKSHGGNERARAGKDGIPKEAPDPKNPTGRSRSASMGQTTTEVPRRPCDHDCHWREIHERALCSRCTMLSSRNTYQCLGCYRVACAPCKRLLREGRGKD
ncbi:hypothetical protein F4780DRAFT_512965 [Xylariomycetidae sp. FL0641]|nr:hypothetical protein F4780DRAFT_512965 [Xylariomycetidae sp. FL0641]